MSPFPYRLAAIDIDDTLVGPDKKIGKPNREAIQRLSALGCRVVLASGRRHANMLPFHRKLHLTGFIVSSQGAVARHAETGQVVHSAPLLPRESMEIVSDGLARGMTVLYYASDGVYAHRPTEWTRVYESDSNERLTFTDLATLNTRSPEKIIWAADPRVIQSIEPQLAARYRGRLLTTITNPYYMEFNAPQATKAEGIAAVAKQYGIHPSEVLAFGDGNNDVPMLSWAGLGVAMSHGRPAAKKAAGLVSPEGDPESSLARAVDLILQRRGAAA